MTALANELRGLGVTSLFTQETSPLFPVGHSSVDDVSGLVDNLLVLQHQQAGRRLERHLSVVKLRGSSFDPVARPFEIAASGIRLLPVGDGRTRRGATRRG
jgi:KaiC/GvpD/RAD55 family RecA-like ATPase